MTLPLYARPPPCLWRRSPGSFNFRLYKVNKTNFPSKSFFYYLRKRSESDTSVVGTLRRSLTLDPGTDARTFPLIEPWTSKMSAHARGTIYLAAGFWSLAVRQSKGKPVLSFPAAMHRVYRSTNSDSVEKRFTRLLDSDADELRWRLRSNVTLLTSQGIALEWPQLLADMLDWNRSSDVQVKWARDFWGQSEAVA